MLRLSLGLAAATLANAAGTSGSRSAVCGWHELTEQRSLPAHVTYGTPCSETPLVNQM